MLESVLCIDARPPVQTDEWLASLRELTMAAPGRSPIHVLLTSSEGSETMVEFKERVQLSEPLLDEAERIFGDGRVAIRRKEAGQ
jgi:hypothetical protein